MAGGDDFAVITIDGSPKSLYTVSVLEEFTFTTNDGVAGELY